MKETFYILLSKDGVQSVEKAEGELDSKNGIYYDKTVSGWRATDKYSGRALAIAKNTKKECQEAVSTIIDKFNEIRTQENYLQGYINFMELVESK